MVETPFVSSCMRSLCGRKQRRRRRQNLLHRVVDLSLPPYTASSITALAASLVALGYNRPIVLVPVFFPSFSLYIAQLLVHCRRIHIDTAYRAEPHCLLIACRLDSLCTLTKAHIHYGAHWEPAVPLRRGEAPEGGPRAHRLLEAMGALRCRKAVGYRSALTTMLRSTSANTSQSAKITRKHSKCI